MRKYKNKNRKKFITQYISIDKVERWTLCNHIATYMYYSSTATLELFNILQGLKDDEQYPRDIN